MYTVGYIRVHCKLSLIHSLHISTVGRTPSPAWTMIIAPKWWVRYVGRKERGWVNRHRETHPFCTIEWGYSGDWEVAHHVWQAGLGICSFALLLFALLLFRSFALSLFPSFALRSFALLLFRSFPLSLFALSLFRSFPLSLFCSSLFRSLLFCS